MAEVHEFKVFLPAIDAEVDEAFKKRFLVLLRDGFEGKELIDNMSAYLMWKYRENWGNIVDTGGD